MTAILSGAVALLALGVSTYNVVLQRQQIRAQVWPHLSWSYSQVDGLTFNLINEGVGPAKVKSIVITVDKQPMRNWHDVLDKLGLRAKDYGTSTINHMVIPPNSKQPALQMPNDERVHPLIDAWGQRLGMDVCYCSVLDECWDLDEQPRSSCPQPPVSFEQ